MVSVLLLLGCKGMGALAPFSSAACPQLESGDPLSATYAADALVNARIAAFVAASASLHELSLEMSGTASQACASMAADLGATVPASNEGADPGSSTKASCGALAARIDQILEAGVSAKVKVDAQAPRCEVDASTKAECSGKCEVELTPGEIVARCDPGKLSGRCEGTCTGRCDGTCDGACDGACSAKNASGECEGQCDGQCNGSCDATCHAGCKGEWQAPKCEAKLTPPKASADCQASCSARAEFKASCEPAKVNVEASADVEEVTKLVATLRAHLPLLLKAQIGMGKRVLGEVETVVRIGADMPNAIGEAGLQAAACVAAAAHASTQASVRIRVSVEASAKVSGKVGAST
ncbi:MAG: hypothetical protein RJA70_1270 [Pseudomonadota bacterium]